MQQDGLAPPGERWVMARNAREIAGTPADAVAGSRTFHLTSEFLY
jgi:hypothetical protein